VKGVFPDSDPLFLGTASGMMADGLILDMIKRADLVIGIGYDPVESDKVWHKDIKLLSINGYSIAYQSYQPYMDVVGDIKTTLQTLMKEDFSSHRWEREDLKDFKRNLAKKMTPLKKPGRGLFSPYEIVQKTREVLSPRAIVTTDVGAHKFIMGQAWRALPSSDLPDVQRAFVHGLRPSRSHRSPARLAAVQGRLRHRRRRVLHDLQDLETAVRLSLPLVIMVFCDGSLGLIEMVQRRRGYPQYGVNLTRFDSLPWQRISVPGDQAPLRRRTPTDFLNRIQFGPANGRRSRHRRLRIHGPAVAAC